MKTRKLVYLFAAVLMLAVLGACAEKGGAAPGTLGSGAAAAENDLPKGATGYKLGDVAQGKKYTLTVDSVDATPEYGDFVTNDPDKMFFFTSLELTNNSDADVKLGDILKISVDDEECTWGVLLDKYNGVDRLDAIESAEAGKKVKGYIVVNVPNKWNEVQLLCDDVAFTFTHADLGSISSQNTTGEIPTYTVGDTLTRNGMKITLTAVVQTDYIQQDNYFYYEPDAGNDFVIVFFDVCNDSEQSQQFKANAVFSPYVDDYAAKFTAFLNTKINGVEELTGYNTADILPGKSVEGYAVMQVPQGWQKIEMTSRQGNFEITADQVTIQ